jgi:cytochrome c oxidase assembly factor CtaG
VTRRLALALCCSAGPAAAHGPSDPPSAAWNWDLSTLLPLLALAILYVIGASRLRVRARAHAILVWRAALFALGWLALTGALLSPLHALGKRAFAPHMTEHEILIAIAAPLLVITRPGAALLWALPRAGRRLFAATIAAAAATRVWRFCVDPLIAATLHGIALWAWHIPAAFERAVRDDALHWLQHFSFLVTALLFWQAVLPRAVHHGRALFALFATVLHSGFLGILIAFAPAPLYPTQSGRGGVWGLDPLSDQQLAGLIMWIPPGLVYTAAALALCAAWIAHSGRTAFASPPGPRS